ncbi:glycerophosphodiester phosphodiesterase [Microlunatus sp. GCM10028923]|uniref:glycerophosphodiester phosphodiesterase n=1 Tax=Microlunatus sp. GCM10028923 TaxID=3273400 RepID=UPI00361610CD
MIIAGHRGAMAHHPENSLESFAAAEAAGADEIELDVRRTRDGVLIVLHDATLDRVALDSSGHGMPPVAELTYDEVSAIMLDSGRPVLTLEEAYRATKITLQVELKDPGCVEALAAFFDDHPDRAARTIFTSFHADALERAKELIPGIPRGIIVFGHPSAEEYPEGIPALLRRTGSDIFHCGWPGLTREVVDAMHADGHPVRGWPMRDREDLERAIALGIDGTTSDDPALARSWYEELTGVGHGRR